MKPESSLICIYCKHHGTVTRDKSPCAYYYKCNRCLAEWRRRLPEKPEERK